MVAPGSSLWHEVAVAALCTPMAVTAVPHALTGAPIGSWTAFPEPRPLCVAVVSLTEALVAAALELAADALFSTELLVVVPAAGPMVQLVPPAAVASPPTSTEFPQRLIGNVIGSWSALPESTPDAGPGVVATPGV